MRRYVMLGLVILLGGLLGVSRFYPRVSRVEVQGNRHHSDEAILRIARVEPGTPFFRITRSRVNDLVTDPWIHSAQVLKRWPDTLTLQVLEREPALSDGLLVYAADGTVLPGTSAAERQGLTQLSGWGGDRFDESLALFSQLAEFGPEVLSYSPAGFTIQLADVQLFTPSAELLQENWSSFISQQGRRVYVYPWGVSSAHD